MRFICLLLLTMSLGLVSCGGGTAPKEVTATRAAPKAPAMAQSEPPAMDSEQRFGFTAPMVSPHGAKSPEFGWETPPGWEAKAPTSMRMANFALGEAGEGECYLTVLAGTAGGLEANINRWQSDQMGQAPLSLEEIAALPKITVLGKPGTFLEVSGEFTGMGGDPQSGSMLLGLVCELDGRMLFVKATGPAAVIQGEKEHFLAFCQSLKPAE